MIITLARGVDASDWTKDEIAASIHTLTDSLLLLVSTRRGTSGSFVDQIELLSEERFRFRDRVYPLSFGQFALLEQIVLNGGSVDFATLGEEIWGDDMTPRNRIEKNVSLLKRKLHDLRAPFSVKTKQQQAVLFLPAGDTPPRDARRIAR